MGHNVERNPIGKVTNVPVAFATGKELHPPILRILVMYGGQDKR